MTMHSRFRPPEGMVATVRRMRRIAPEPEASDREPAALFGFVRRRLPLIATTVLVLNLLLVCALFALPPGYTASALIRADVRQNNLLDPDSPFVRTPGESALVESEVGMLRSPALFLAVIDSLDLVGDAGFAAPSRWETTLRPMLGLRPVAATPEERAAATLKELRRRVSITRDGVTYLIRIEADAPDPDEAARLANAVANIYIERQVQAKIEAIDAARQKVTARLEGALSSLRQAESRLGKASDARQEVEVSRALYDRLLTSARAIDAQRDLQVADSRIVSPAMPPAEPSFPNKPLLLGIGGVLSLAIALVLAFLRENVVGGFVDEAQARAVLGAPVLASLPGLGSAYSWSGDASRPANIVVTSPRSAYSEAVRRLRLGVDAGRSAEEEPTQVVLVTSAVPGEGKTQIAVSLARSLAMAGRRTLLVDCDLRRPALHRATGLTPRRTLASYLQGRLDDVHLPELVIDDPLTGLRLILGAGGLRGPVDGLLDSPRLGHLLRNAEKWFDFIVLDSPPLLPVVDARILARHATAALLVLRWADTSQRAARLAFADLAAGEEGALGLGVVLNQVRRGAFARDYPARRLSRGMFAGVRPG